MRRMTGEKQPYRLVIGALSLLLTFSLGLNFTVVAPVLPLIIDDYEVNRGAASLLMSAVIIVQAALSVPAGFMVTRLPLKRILGLGWLLGGAMLFTPLVSSFYGLLALRLVYSLGATLVMPAIAPLNMRWFSRRELPVVNSLTFAAMILGIAAGTLLAVPVSRLIGWERMLAVTAALLPAGAVLWMLLGSTPPTAKEGAGRLSFREVLRALKSKTTLLIAMADGGAFGQYMALATWLPSFYSEVRGMDLARAAFVTGLMPLAGLVAVLSSGYLSARTGLRRPFVILPGLMVGLAGLGTFLVGNEILIYVSVICVGLASFFYIPPLFTIPMDIEDRSPERVAVVWATAIAMASVFGIISPMAVGFMTDAFGTYTPGFAIWSVVAFCLLLGGILLPETGPRARQALLRSLGTKVRHTKE